MNWQRVILGMTEPSTNGSWERLHNPATQGAEKVAKMNGGPAFATQII